MDGINECCCDKSDASFASRYGSKGVLKLCNEKAEKYAEDNCCYDNILSVDLFD